jgi:TRAP-type C4-dicarboxylate transport system permease small subunit
MDGIFHALGRVIDGLLALLLAAMVLLVFGNVVLRYGFNSGITVSEELSRWFFVWMTFLGAAVGLKDRAHLGTDLMLARLGPAGRRVCLLVAQALMLFVTVLVLRGSWVQTGLNLEVEAPVSGFSMAWLNVAGVVFAVLTLPILARDLWRTATGRLGDDELVMVRESEDQPHPPSGGTR